MFFLGSNLVNQDSGYVQKIPLIKYALLMKIKIMHLKFLVNPFSFANILCKFESRFLRTNLDLSGKMNIPSEVG